MIWHTAQDARSRDLLILPVGAFEQHGMHLPLATDTLIANVLAGALAERIDGVCIPPVAVSCSHEHLASGFTIAAETKAVFAYIEAIVDGAFSAGIAKIVILNSHGGNYFLGNLVQQANARDARVHLGPGRHIMERAFARARIETSVSDDMHGGEYETSVMLAYHPEAVRMEKAVDIEAVPRPLLNTLGMRAYTDCGIIGRPTRATAEKGQAVVAAIADLLADELEGLWPGSRR